MAAWIWRYFMTATNPRGMRSLSLPGTGIQIMQSDFGTDAQGQPDMFSRGFLSSSASRTETTKFQAIGANRIGACNRHDFCHKLDDEDAEDAPDSCHECQRNRCTAAHHAPDTFQRYRLVSVHFTPLGPKFHYGLIIAVTSAHR